MTVHDDMQRLREAWRDLVWVCLRAWGVIWVARKIGLTLKPWIEERESRRRP